MRQCHATLNVGHVTSECTVCIVVAKYSKLHRDKTASQRRCQLSEASPHKPSHRLVVAKERDVTGMMTAAAVVTSTVDM